MSRRELIEQCEGLWPLCDTCTIVTCEESAAYAAVEDVLASDDDEAYIEGEDGPASATPAVDDIYTEFAYDAGIQLEHVQRQLTVVREIAKDVAIGMTAQLNEAHAENARLMRQIDAVREARDSAFALGVHIYAYEDAPERFKMHADDADWVVVVPKAAVMAQWPLSLEEVLDARGCWVPYWGEPMIFDMENGDKVLIFCHA